MQLLICKIKVDKKRHPREKSWMSVNVDSIVLIKILSQLTLSGCSRICKWLKPQQLRQLPQFSMKIQKEHLERGSLYVL